MGIRFLTPLQTLMNDSTQSKDSAMEKGNMIQLEDPGLYSRAVFSTTFDFHHLCN